VEASVKYFQKTLVSLGLSFTSILLSSLASADPAIFDVLDYGADPAAGTNDEAAIHDAFDAALASSGTLYFPVGTWAITSPLVITKRIEIRGDGPKAMLAYSGAGGAIQGAFAGTDVEQTSIHDLRVNGTNAEGQSAIVMGTNGVAMQMLTIRNVVTENFANGYGIHIAAGSIGTRIVQNKIGVSREAITLRSACASEVAQNFLSYWANTGIRYVGVSGDGVAPRDNVIRQNTIHGNGVVAQDILQDRAAIKLDGTSSSSIENNYIETITAPAGGGGKVGHGVWLVKSALPLTQANRIFGNYFGPNISGDAIRLSAGASHTSIGGNQTGNTDIYDDGSYTVFQLQFFYDAADLTGTSTTRRGWMGLVGSAVQLHP
jgi:hypothetical protein